MKPAGSLERFRFWGHPMLGSSAADGNNGCFTIESPEPGWVLIIIASDQGSWEHVSVHASNHHRVRTPSWKEMCFVKDLFWTEEEVVMQLHPAKSEYVDVHKNTLHLWRPIGQDIPLPPPRFV